ncbi:hypothetical protein ZTR_09625 [Talaromyces verruculosus]|nr:hypothetical protein ZTR_09625 [Talaromyces verruculosus]
MTLHCEPSISVYKSTILPSTLPSTLARDFNNKNTNNNEIIHERKSIQSLIDSSKKPPYTRIDTILTNFIPEEYGDVGKSMTQGGKAKDISCDVHAVFRIASQLLSLDSSTDTISMSWIIAKNFVTMPSTVDPRTLLKHPFLKLGQGSWYLSSIGGLLSFVRTTGLDECSKSSPSNSDEKTSSKDMATQSDKECLPEAVNSGLPKSAYRLSRCQTCERFGLNG